MTAGPSRFGTRYRTAVGSRSVTIGSPGETLFGMFSLFTEDLNARNARLGVDRERRESARGAHGYYNEGEGVVSENSIGLGCPPMVVL